MLMFVVVYFAGHVVGSFGPFGFDMNTCNYFVDMAYENNTRDYDTPDGVVLKGVDYSCELLNKVPIIGSTDNRLDKVHHF
jgi:hypothetical protein